MLMTSYHVYTVRMSPVLNRSFMLECFERGSAIKICNGIMFISTQDCHICMCTCMYLYCDSVPPS